MAVYVYSGLDTKGKAVSGIIDADSPKVARSRLRSQGVFVTEVSEDKKGGGIKGEGLNVEIDVSKYFQVITSRDVATLTKQLATLVGAAIPMAEALSALVDQAEKQKIKVILSEVKEKVNEGSTLADALADHPRVFNNLYIQMVRAGERSGALDQVLRRLTAFTEASVKLQGKITSALIYPLILAIVGLLIITGLFVGVIPRIRQLFEDMPGGEEALPLITKVVFFLGDTMLSPWMIVIAVVVGGSFYGLWRHVQTEVGRQRFDTFRLRVPVFGKVSRLVSVARFCRTLATLLVSGVPIITAMNIVRNVVNNVILARAIDEATHNIREGQSIAQPLKASGQFPPIVTHMIAIGEKTGELESMLTSVADAYEAEVEATVDAMTSLLGPVVILAMAGTVFVVAIALLLPMMSLSSMIR